jgi:hypothetical protein
MRGNLNHINKKARVVADDDEDGPSDVDEDDNDDSDGSDKE